MVPHLGPHLFSAHVHTIPEPDSVARPVGKLEDDLEKKQMLQ